MQHLMSSTRKREQTQGLRISYLPSTTMFKTAATKIAHNSTLPAMAGNQDLRPLQDLITAEKTVMTSLQKLSVDYSKAAEALRTWGLNEGDDLKDTLSASTSLLNQFSATLSQYATHGHAMRDQLKSIRKREEALDELKQRRRTLVRKAEDAEKKLSKMNPGHKNLNMQTDLLNRLRDEIRAMDSDIMSKEAALGDFKRTASRMWVGLKFGGLLECCEKGTILAESGKLVVSEIPEDITQPGLPRSLYYGHSKTGGFVAEALQRVNEVGLSSVPTVGFRDRKEYDQVLPTGSQLNQQASGYELPEMRPGPWSPTDAKPSSPQNQQQSVYQLPQIMEDESMSNLQRPYGILNAPGSPATSFGGSFAHYPQHQNYYFSGSGHDSRTMPLSSQGSPMLDSIDHQTSIDEFGVSSRSGFMDNSNTAGGRFATFPVEIRPAGTTDDQDQSLSSPATEIGQPEMVSLGWGSLNENPPPPQVAAPSTKDFENFPPQDCSRPPTPVPALHEISTQQSPTLADSPTATSPPLGAAASDLSHPLANAPGDGSLQAPSHTRSISQISHNDDALLVHMTSAHEDSNSTDEEVDVSKSGADSSAAERGSEAPR